MSFCTSHQAYSRRKRESVRRLKLALAQDRLTLRYQPIFAAADGRAEAAEALLRWRQPDEESDDLGKLLLAAERSPVIFALEAWAIEVCFRDAAWWHAEALPGLRVNLNLSAREFQRADLLPTLTRALETHRLDAERVTLEVTETSAIHEPEAVSRIRAADARTSGNSPVACAWTVRYASRRATRTCTSARAHWAWSEAGSASQWGASSLPSADRRRSHRA